MAVLPMDVILNEILPKLPAKSLLRFKCVCKSFRTQITSSKFINHHLQTSLTSINNRLLIYRIRNLSNKFYCISLDSPDTSTTELPLPTYDDVPNLKGSYAHFLSCCNGLLLFRISVYNNATDIYYNQLFLLNPSTGMGTDCNPIDSFPKNYHMATYGFGFDSQYNDYKIVQIVQYDVDDVDDDGDVANAVEYVNRREVKVYSMRSNSWRLVEDKRPCMYNLVGAPVVVDYFIHWMIYHGNDRYEIVCFNLRDEVWENDILLPDYIVENRFIKPVELGVVDRCLCLMTYGYGCGKCLWVMKEYGVKESWTKVVANLTQPMQIGFSKDGKSRDWDIWIRKHQEPKHLFYEAMAKTNKLVLPRVDPSDLEAYLCLGTLVPMPQGK